MYREAYNAREKAWVPKSLTIPRKTFERHLVSFPRVTVDIVLCNKKEDEVLLVYRNEYNTDYTDMWATIGGGVAKWETLTHAAQRITEREIGQHLALEDFEFKGVQEIFAEKGHYLDSVFLAHTPFKNVHIDKTSSGAIWFSLKDLMFISQLHTTYKSILEIAGVLP